MEVSLFTSSEVRSCAQLLTFDPAWWLLSLVFELHGVSAVPLCVQEKCLTIWSLMEE